MTMLNKYYYLISSLPFLKFEDTLAIKRDDFIFQCSKWLSDAQFKMLVDADVNETAITPSDAEILKEYKRFDLLLREELATVRKARKKGAKEKIPALISSVYADEIPLEMERRLAKIKWDFLDEKEFGFHFDLNFLILYFLKLQILERLRVFNSEKGLQVFESLCEVNYGQ